MYLIQTSKTVNSSLQAEGSARIFQDVNSNTNTSIDVEAYPFLTTAR